MSDASNQVMLRRYEERQAQVPMFLSGFFRSPPENFHTTEKVEIDILRNDPHVAVPVPTMGTGARRVEASHYVNKGFTPPIYELETSIGATEQMRRQPGQDPFQSPDFLANAVNQSFRHMRILEDMIRRAVELQASQVLQSGTVDLQDEDTQSVYTLNYEPKSSHFVTVGTDWAQDGSTGDPLQDLQDLAEVIRRDGRLEPTDLIFGAGAWNRFAANEEVKNRLDNRRMDFGMLRPETRGTGATFMGFIWAGAYRFNLWVYKDTYIDPATGDHVPYVGDDRVIMMNPQARLDLSFGAIPRIVPPDAQARQFLPPRMSLPERGFDLSTNVWIAPNGKSVMLEAGTRPLCIPTAIDTFGALDVVA